MCNVIVQIAHIVDKNIKWQKYFLGVFLRWFRLVKKNTLQLSCTKKTVRCTSRDLSLFLNIVLCWQKGGSAKIEGKLYTSLFKVFSNHTLGFKPDKINLKRRKYLSLFNFSRLSFLQTFIFYKKSKPLDQYNRNYNFVWHLRFEMSGLFIYGLNRKLHKHWALCSIRLHIFI